MSLSQTNRGFRVLVARINNAPEQWSWTIVRPNGVKMVETGFGSRRAAMSAGRLALEEFLEKRTLMEANGT
jgi:hypothetical protein